MRLLPWVAMHARLGSTYAFLDCDRCKRSHSQQVRAGLKCGWVRGGINADGDVYGEWLKPTTPGWGIMGGKALKTTVCPGYSVLMAVPQEVARAWSWEKSSTGMVARYRALGAGMTYQVSELVDLFTGEQAAAESWEMDERSRRMKTSGGT